MFAIVEIVGQQFKIVKDQKVFVHRLSSKEGAKVSFDKVLLLDDNGNVTLGAPAIEGASVEAKVLRHLKGDKVIVFKKKRRKGYEKKNGHRQSFTEIVIEAIMTTGGVKKASSSKKEVAPKVEKFAEVAEEKATPKASKKEGDDLKIVEGIGPKIANIFNNEGIITFNDLANTSVEKLKEILTTAGPAYASKTPDTWPQQAQLAAEGKWEELKKWQDELMGGK